MKKRGGGSGAATRKRRNCAVWGRIDGEMRKCAEKGFLKGQGEDTSKI